MAEEGPVEEEEEEDEERAGVKGAWIDRRGTVLLGTTPQQEVSHEFFDTYLP